MALIEPDFTEVSDQIDPGEYKVRIKEAKPGEFSTGTKYINWYLETFDEQIPKNNGRIIFHKTPTHGKGAFRLQQFYKAVVGETLGSSFDTEMMLGKECSVVVVDGTDRDGNPSGYPDVKTVKAIH